MHAQDRHVGQPGENIGVPRLRVDVVHFAVTMRVFMSAAGSPPRSDPAKSHDFRPSATPRRARSAALFVRQIRPSLRNAVKAWQRPSLSNM